MSDNNYVILPPQILPGENGLDVTALPRSTRICKGPHVYDPTIVNNKPVGYVGAVYNRSEHEYPKVLYHPKWGQKRQPEGARYFVGAVTPEQHQNAMAAFEKALVEWQRSNRIKLAKSAEDEERLIKLGWLDKPPIPKDTKAFDLDSDEI